MTYRWVYCELHRGVIQLALSFFHFLLQINAAHPKSSTKMVSNALWAKSPGALPDMVKKRVCGVGLVFFLFLNYLDRGVQNRCVANWPARTVDSRCDKKKILSLSASFTKTAKPRQQPQSGFSFFRLFLPGNSGLVNYSCACRSSSPAPHVALVVLLFQ